MISYNFNEIKKISLIMIFFFIPLYENDIQSKKMIIVYIQSKEKVYILMVKKYYIFQDMKGQYLIFVI